MSVKTKKRPAAAKPKGRPPVKVDLEQLETLASMGCTLDEIASVVKLSVRQLMRRQKEAAFLEMIERGRAAGRASLRHMQWQAAKQGNVTAQIWLGKQLLGQRSFEKPEPEVAVKPDKVEYGWVSKPPTECSEGSNTTLSPPSGSSTN